MKRSVRISLRSEDWREVRRIVGMLIKIGTEETGEQHFRVGAGKETSAVSLFIDFPAVGNAGDAYLLAVVINHVHNAIIADADAPEILVTVQFPAAGRSWICGQTIYLRCQSRDEAIAQALQLLLGGRLHIEGVSRHVGVRA